MYTFTRNKDKSFYILNGKRISLQSVANNFLLCIPLTYFAGLAAKTQMWFWKILKHLGHGILSEMDPPKNATKEAYVH